MTALLTWLASLAPALTAFFARKAATISAFTLAFFAAITVYLGCMAFLRDLVEAASVAMPTTDVVGQSISWASMIGQFIPSNLLNCVTIIVDAYICRVSFLLVQRWIIGTAAAS